MTGPRRRPRRQREDYARGLPGYHDPTAGFAGAAPARSALTLRAWLAGFGLVACLVGAGLAVYLGVQWFAWVMVVVAVIAAVDLGWVLRRKARGEPG
jgi:membrane protein implicated in regulation of membrane protease activity